MTLQAALDALRADLSDVLVAWPALERALDALEREAAELVGELADARVRERQLADLVAGVEVGMRNVCSECREALEAAMDGQGEAA